MRRRSGGAGLLVAVLAAGLAAFLGPRFLAPSDPAPPEHSQPAPEQPLAPEPPPAIAPETGGGSPAPIATGLDRGDGYGRRAPLPPPPVSYPPKPAAPAAGGSAGAQPWKKPSLKNTRWIYETRGANGPRTTSDVAPSAAPLAINVPVRGASEGFTLRLATLDGRPLRLEGGAPRTVYEVRNLSSRRIQVELRSAAGESWRLDLAPGGIDRFSSRRPLGGENAVAGGFEWR